MPTKEALETYDKGFADGLRTFAWTVGRSDPQVGHPDYGMTLYRALAIRRGFDTYRLPEDSEQQAEKPLDPPETAKEFWDRLRAFCAPTPEGIEAMTPEEIREYLEDEGIDIEPARQTLRAKLAEIRARLEQQEAAK